MATTTETPASWLLAYQIKREHGFLQQQIKNIQSTCDEQESRNVKHEKALHTAMDTFDQLHQDSLQQTQTCGQQISNGLAKIEHQHRKSTEDLKQQVEDRLSTIAYEEQKRSKLQDDRHKVLLREIEQIKASVNEYATLQQHNGKKIHSRQSEKVHSELEAMQFRAKQDGERMLHLEDSIAALQKAQDLLRKQIAELANARQQRGSSSNLLDTGTPKKKSHHWGGGGADRDIITQDVPVTAGRASRSAANADSRAAQQRDVAVRISAGKRKQSPVVITQPEPKKKAVAASRIISSAGRNSSNHPSPLPNVDMDKSKFFQPVAKHTQSARPSHMQQARRPGSESGDIDLDQPLRRNSKTVPHPTATAFPTTAPAQLATPTIARSKKTAVPDVLSSPFVYRKPKEADDVDWDVPPDGPHHSQSKATKPGSTIKSARSSKKNTGRELTTKTLPRNLRPKKAVVFGV